MLCFQQSEVIVAIHDPFHHLQLIDTPLREPIMIIQLDCFPRGIYIKGLCGRPLMAYSIEAAIRSGCFQEVMVSTDSERYAEIARGQGASVPFLRSRATSSDEASSWDMVEEVLNRYRALGREFDTFCLLQPTSPLRIAEDIVAAYKLYGERASFAVGSVCEAEHSPLWCGQLPDDVYQKGSFAYIMPQDRSVDIDTMADFRLAEMIRGGIWTAKTLRHPSSLAVTGAMRISGKEVRVA